MGAGKPSLVGVMNKSILNHVKSPRNNRRHTKLGLPSAVSMEQESKVRHYSMTDSCVMDEKSGKSWRYPITSGQRNNESVVESLRESDNSSLSSNHAIQSP
jgi:hypothetical protein